MAIDFSRVDALMRRAHARRVFPSAVLLVGRQGEIAFQRAYGRATPDTVYDVASLTKPLVATLYAMRLVADGKLDLDAPVRDQWYPLDFLEEADVRVWHLLSHSAGLPAHRPYYQRVWGERAMVRLIGLEPLVYQPGTRSLYSDLGFMLLTSVLESAARRMIWTFLYREVVAPLGLTGSAFIFPVYPVRRADGTPGTAIRPTDRPTHRAYVECGRIAPTGRCPWRKRVLLAEVNDCNAFAAGSVTGYAGLFTQAVDVHAIVKDLVSSWSGGPGLIPREVVREFWRRRLPGRSTWALGWDTPSPRGSSAGARWSRRGVGHLGYTGCSLWIDPERARWVVLLSNRTHPSPKNVAIRAFRPRLHDAVVEAFGAP